MTLLCARSRARTIERQHLSASDALRTCLHAVSFNCLNLCSFSSRLLRDCAAAARGAAVRDLGLAERGSRRRVPRGTPPAGPAPSESPSSQSQQLPGTPDKYVLED